MFLRYLLNIYLENDFCRDVCLTEGLLFLSFRVVKVLLLSERFCLKVIAFIRLEMRFAFKCKYIPVYKSFSFREKKKNC